MIIADSSVGSLDGRDVSQSLSPSGVNWGGLTIDPSSASGFRERVRVAASISGDLTGPVEVGRVFRIQTGGDIDAPILASAHATTALGYLSIGYVVASGSITSNARVEALGVTPPDLAERADIQSVQMLSGSGAMNAPVIARCGNLGTVISRGPITIEAPGGILAAWGIDRVEAYDPNATAFRDVEADISANAGNEEHLDAVLQQLLARNLSGAVSCGHLGGDYSVAFGVHGVMSGSVHANGNLKANFEVASTD